MGFLTKNKKILILLIFIAIFFSFALAFTNLSKKYVSQGDAYATEGLYKKALLAYEKSLVLNPLNSSINIKMANIFEQNNDDKNAIYELSLAIEKNRSDYETIARYLELLLKNGKFDDAYKQLVLNKKAHNNDKVSLSASKILYLSGKKEAAEKMLEAQDNETASKLKSVYAFLQGNFDRAHSLAEDLPEKDGYRKALLYKGKNQDYRDILVAQSLNESAMPYFGQAILEKLINEGKNYRDLYLYLGYSYLAQNNVKKAEGALVKAKESDPVYGMTYYLLGKTKLLAGKKNEALGDLKSSLFYGFKNDLAIRMTQEVCP